MNFLFTNVAYASVDSFMMSVNKQIINPLIVFMFALALAIFLFGIVQFLANPENEEAKTKGKSHMIWGIVGLTIMVGVWFILNVIMNTLNIKNIVPEKGTVKLSDYSASNNWKP